ncbi:hypothetical protein MLD38_021053 [Melastoma candidum]|uniref:Uncharacterized protein n=1 Tax=Melastoma candidum TaxID=119954 RepID=A0ACB9QHT7_9MYRT|nr:hypothetical protein MLD38_021053 [Melastoma candidum]
MEINHRKLFVGRISWDTNEELLKDYFRKFGDVVESVIMRDRATKRAQGFGFVVFAYPAVAERVVQQKHMIAGDFTSSPASDYAPRSGSRVSPGGVPSFVSLYGRGLHGELNLNSGFGINGRPIDNGPSGSVIGGIPLLSQYSSSLWGDVGLNFTSNSGNITGSGRDNPLTDPYRSIRKLWGSSSSSSNHGGFDGTEFGGFMSNFGSIEGCYSGSHRRTSADLGVVGPPSSYMESKGGHGNLDLYESSLAYGDPSWRSSSSSLDMEDSSSLNFGLRNTTADVMTRVSAGYVGYGMATVK